MAMFTRRITSALFAIAIASSLITASSLVGSALAKKERDGQTNTITDPNGTDVSSTPKSLSANAGGSSGTTDDTGGVSAKDLKSLSKCQSGAAKDGDLTLADVDDCYGQVFDQGAQGQGTGQSSSAGGNDQSQGGQGQGENQITSSFLHGQKSTLLGGLPS
jgi:hypothetical protein